MYILPYGEDLELRIYLLEPSIILTPTQYIRHCPNTITHIEVKILPIMEEMGRNTKKISKLL